MRDTSVFVFDVLFFLVNCLFPLRALPMLFLHIVLFFPLLLFSLFCFLYTGYRFVFWGVSVRLRLDGSTLTGQVFWLPTVLWEVSSVAFTSVQEVMRHLVIIRFLSLDLINAFYLGCTLSRHQG